MAYFDNAATTFPKPECVYEALDQFNRTLAMNVKVLKLHCVQMAKYRYISFHRNQSPAIPYS